MGVGGRASLDAHATTALLDAVGVASLGAQTPADATALRVRLRHDRDVGPVLTVGPSGQEAASAVALHPLAGEDVEDLLSGLREDPRLNGVDLEEVGYLLLRLGAVVEAVDDLETLDLDPVLIGARGLAVAASAIALAEPR